MGQHCFVFVKIITVFLLHSRICDLILENRPSCHMHLVFREIPILNIQATVVPLC